MSCLQCISICLLILLHKYVLNIFILLKNLFNNLTNIPTAISKKYFQIFKEMLCYIWRKFSIGIHGIQSHHLSERFCAPSFWRFLLKRLFKSLTVDCFAFETISKEKLANCKTWGYICINGTGPLQFYYCFNNFMLFKRYSLILSTSH